MQIFTERSLSETLPACFIERDCTDSGAWDAYVQAKAAATNYHQFAWRQVIEKSFGHRCQYLAARDVNGMIVGVLPLVQMQSMLFGNFLISIPFMNYGGLLCDDDQIAALLLSEAETARQSCGAAYVELRHAGFAVPNLPTKEHKVTMLLALEQAEDAQWKIFNAKLRNQVRKAEKSGLQPVIGQIELLDGFYDVFVRNMRDLGTPVYAKAFFRQVLEAFPDTTRIIGVVHEKRMIAAGFVSWYRGTIETPWASSIADYKAFCPNNMLYWEAIKFAISNGFTKFDFGRSTPNEGTFNFKKQWGAEPVQLYWQYLLESGQQLPEINTKNPKYEMAIRMWQKLPLALTKILGPNIVRNIP
jgi:FemAB-related protein (PEP-CTERM system-associated)